MTRKTEFIIAAVTTAVAALAARDPALALSEKQTTDLISDLQNVPSVDVRADNGTISFNATAHGIAANYGVQLPTADDDQNAAQRWPT